MKRSGRSIATAWLAPSSTVSLAPGISSAISLDFQTERVVLGADHVHAHSQRWQPSARLVATSGLDLADERLRALRVRVIDGHAPQVGDGVGLLVELLRQRHQHQRVDDLLARGAPGLGNGQAGVLDAPLAAPAPGHAERQRADAIGRRQRHLLRDRAAERSADEVEGVELERVGELERVERHVRDVVGALGHGRLAGVAIVEDDGPNRSAQAGTCSVQARWSAPSPLTSSSGSPCPCTS